MKEDYRKLGLKALLAILLRASGSLLAFALYAAIGRLLGATGAGLYFLTISIAGFASILAKLGLDNEVLRRIVIAHSRNELSQVQMIFRSGVSLTLLTTSMMGLALLVLSHYIALILLDEPALETPLMFGGFAVVTYAMMLLLGECVKAVGRVNQYMIVSGLVAPAVGLALILPASIVYGASGAVLSYVIGTGSACLVAVYFWRDYLRKASETRDTEPWRVLITRARPLWTMEIINRGLLPFFPIWMMGVFGSSSDVGVLGVALRVSATIALAMHAALAAIIAPLGRSVSAGEILHAKNLLLRFALMFALAAFLPILAVIAFRERIMGLFGPDFVGGGDLLAVLVTGQFVTSLLSVSATLLMLAGKMRVVRNAAIMTLLLLGSVLPIMASAFGAMGVAISVACIGVLGGAYQVNALRRMN